MDRDGYRQESRRAWDQAAPMWDEQRDEMEQVVREVGGWLVAALEAQPGETMLDIAAGNGGLSHALSPLVGDNGRVICTDFAPQMIESARRRGDAKGLSNVEYSEMDAERMELGEATVNGAVCRFGYMLMADPAAAFSETRRVLRDDGRLAFAVWGDPMRNPWVLVPGSVMIERGHMPMPDPDGPGIFSLGSVEKIDDALTGAGLSAAEVREFEVRFRYPDRDTMWSRLSTTMGPISRIISELPEDERAAVRALIEERADAFREGDGYALPGRAIAALVRPTGEVDEEHA